jgi:epoxyqueuosine reductase
MVVAMSYHVPTPPSGVAVPGRVARYARGLDYHKHLKRRLHDLADWLRQETGEETRACVDTAPVLEREWAARAGVGWQGKNTLAIHTRRGSYLLLGEIITTAELAPDSPAVDRCGTCTRCLDACPTDALRPYEMDPRRCISYWTIEHRGPLASIPDDIRRGTGDWLFGCDICQEVCPWNRKAPAATHPDVQPTPLLATGVLDAEQVAAWSPEQYQQTLRGTAGKRAKLAQWRRNATVILQNRSA